MSVAERESIRVRKVEMAKVLKELKGASQRAMELLGRKE